MQNFHLLPLACAISLMSVCSVSIAADQEIITPTAQLQPTIQSQVAQSQAAQIQTAQTQTAQLPSQGLAPVIAPVAPPAVKLKKISPDISAPHYHLNPVNYTAPLNPVLVEEIRQSLTPKMVNISTGEVVERLPLEVPGEPIAAVTTPVSASPAVMVKPLAEGTNTTALGTTALASSAENATALPVVGTSVVGSPVATNAGINANSVANPLFNNSDANATTVIPVSAPPPQDIKVALLKIDPALKLDDQYLSATPTTVAVSATTAPVTPTVDNAALSPATTNSTTTPVIAATSAPSATEATHNPLKILIPKHSATISKTKQRTTPAPSDEQIDVADIDRDLVLIEGKARHYPTKFSSKKERVFAEGRIKTLAKDLDVLAVDPRASYEVLLRAMKANVLARNMDAGPDAAFKSAVYFQRLLKLKPNDPETSFWYGFSLGEGGGFKESIPHLNNALKANYQEAYLALAHSYLQMEDKKNALTMLNNYKIKYPSEASKTDQLISEIEAGNRYSIWQ